MHPNVRTRVRMKSELIIYLLNETVNNRYIAITIKHICLSIGISFLLIEKNAPSENKHNAFIKENLTNEGSIKKRMFIYGILLLIKNTIGDMMHTMIKSRTNHIG